MLMLVAAVLAADPAPLPAWDPSEGEHSGIILTHIGLYGIGSGLGAVATGGTLIATDHCDDCFEPNAQYWAGLAFIAGGLLGVGTALPLVVVGPVMTRSARDRNAISFFVVPEPNGLGIAGTF
jgi:hypothetical protein